MDAVDLVEQTPAPVDAEPVVVYSTGGELAAEVVRGKLESAGIPAMVLNEFAWAVGPMSVGKLGEARVLVPARFAQQAREILAAEHDEDIFEDEYDDDVYNESA
ncbi:MAG: hypothetical protein A2Z04_08500 [Chloroflexi bacterium RBG_16_57_9]|nr:MAG: hypothetical protein A2Z04_08500 [Chloroflexi bacterium RBG_16_57_9]